MNGEIVRINIVTTGRFYVLDLARELSALGHETHFYSFLPCRRAMRFGLPEKCHQPLWPLVAPLLVLMRCGAARQRAWADRACRRMIDKAAALLMEPCDVFIGMSGLCVESALAARRRFGARVYLDRGSRHILSQREILDAAPGAPAGRSAVPDFDVARELRGYGLADAIAVPSRHAEASFLERGVSSARLFRNPYGVDLHMFLPTPAPEGAPPTILFTGTWCWRKGVDVLVEAWRRLPAGTRLMHVGPVAGAPLPKEPGFVHHAAVPQWRLREFYARADVFALASREDGYGLVLPQALACGVPVVCTDRTGGEDIRELIGEQHWISVVPPDNAVALADALWRMLARAAGRTGPREILGSRREALTWAAYGRRWDSELRRRTGKT